MTASARTLIGVLALRIVDLAIELDAGVGNLNLSVD